MTLEYVSTANVKENKANSRWQICQMIVLWASIVLYKGKDGHDEVGRNEREKSDGSNH